MTWLNRSSNPATPTRKESTQDLQGKVDAINRSQAMIEFTLDGTILYANENFLKTLGYTLEEVRGKHHSMFVTPAYGQSPEYRAFWQKLGRGEFDAGQYKRIGKGGREIWIQASYNPVLDGRGKPCKVVKFASDITEQKRLNADYEGKVAAISKSQAVIEFTLDGTILYANENFLKTLGYTLEEVRGKHHSMFVEPVYSQSAEYRAFWEKLGRGEFDAGQYKRIGKGGREIWIQAIYNPIPDEQGKPCKVVKFATDITNQKRIDADYEGKIAAVGKSQAVIEFTLDGTILNANENFLETLGYTLEEVRGKHHSMFVEPAYGQSAEYRAFWQKLGRGEFDAGQYKRIGKGGREVWIQASYNPIPDEKGKPCKVVKFATDITDQRRIDAEYEGQIAAISKSQAVISFTVDGTILDANENFLKTLGYTLEEVRGKHHSMFAEPAYSQSPEYRAFWQKLGRGEFDAGQYKRIGKGGREIWIQASYNPIFDANGKPFKVVKYATDITAQVLADQALKTAVHQTQQVLEATQDNDLAKRVPLDGKSGEIATLCAGINGLLDTTVSIISDIKTAAREVSNASAEISASTTDLSQRTEEQAASLEETSASMEEIASTVKKNAENAQHATQVTNDTRLVAERGGAVVSDAVNAMARIEETSRKVADIIGVIDEIARQTNLLALNAAVEAARAGEAGRGFAVVATEVRSLAQRSSQAAKDIKDLITNSSDQVTEGVELVNRAGASLRDIVDSIKKVDEIVAEIASASIEQSTGVEQVNKALTQMDEVTQQNSALVEQNAATAKTLEAQSTAMDQRVAVFHLDETEVTEQTARPVIATKKAPVQKRPVAMPKDAAPMRLVANGGARHMQAAKGSAANWKEF